MSKVAELNEKRKSRIETVDSDRHVPAAGCPTCGAFDVERFVSEISGAPCCEACFSWFDIEPISEERLDAHEFYDDAEPTVD